MELTTPGLSIFQIESELAELMSFRDQEELTPEERAATDVQIQEYVKREVSKVDNLRAYMRHCAVMADAAKQESEIQAKRVASWKNKLDFLKGFCLDAMNVMGKKRLEGRTGYLLNKANGGKQALTINDASLIPESLVIYCGMMLPEAMAAIPEQVRGRQDFQFDRVPKQEAIRAAMEKPCAECGGIMVVALYPQLGTQSDTIPCGHCNGTGKQSVPGARLEPRGSHIEVK